MKLSVILPVYNVEAYIERCILSIENQDIPKNEYEIIAVNDGSKDASPQIIENLQQKFGNIILIHKENGGLSSARNYGLKHARGQYIWFVDSDDYIEKDTLGRLLMQIASLDLDMLAFNIYDVWNDREASGFVLREQPTSVISGEEYVRKYRIGISACFFIVKKSLLDDNGLSFTEGIIHEDYEFTLKLYRHVKRMAFEPLRVYNYIHRENSITTTKSHEQILKSIHSWQTILKNEISVFNDESSYSRYAQIWINNHKFNALCVLFFYRLTLEEKKLEFKRFKEMGAFKIGKTRLGSIKMSLICRVLRISWLYYFLMHFIRLQK